MSNNNQSATKKFNNVCTSQLKTATEKFVWTIDKFSEREEKFGEYLQSSEFSCAAPNGQLLKWRMVIYPNGYTEEYKDYVSHFIYLSDPKNGTAEAKYQVSVRKSNGEEVNLKSFDKKSLNFGQTVNWYGKYRLVKREEVFNEENGYLNNDQFTIVCQLIVQQKLVETAPLPDVEVPECQALEDLSRLFEESLFTDCKITSEDDKEYKVHKCILGCRSPVFGAMFEHEMLEKNSNEIKIEDMKGKVIEAMLRFIYSGKEPADLDDEMAQDLLIGAEKYELIRLKLICERKLINSLVNENVCELLVLANLHSAEHLKTNAINFIKAHMNEVMETEGWEAIMADGQLMKQVLKAMAK